MKPNAAIALIKYAATLDIQVMRFAELRSRIMAGGWRRSAHRVDFFHLIAVTSGQCRHLVDFVTTPCQAGDWLLIKPGQVHAFDFDAQWDGWLLVFKPEALPAKPTIPGRETSADMAGTLPARMTPSAAEHHTAVCMLAQMAADCHEHPQLTAGNALLRSALQHLLLRMQLLFRPPDSQHAAAANKATADRFQRFSDMVETGLHRQQPAHHYANRLGCSEKSLNRAVQAATGLTAKGYLLQRTALEAKRLLVHTTLPVSTIGMDLGFDEASNFVKFFKRETGMLPKAFRQRYAAANPPTPPAH